MENSFSILFIRLNLRCYKSFMAGVVIAAHLPTGEVLLMLGKVQFELQKLVDSYVSAYCYGVIFSSSGDIIYYCSFYLILDPFPFVHQRAHILMTITNPSESLLNDLRTVEVCSHAFLSFYYHWRFHIIFLLGDNKKVQNEVLVVEIKIVVMIMDMYGPSLSYI